MQILTIPQKATAHGDLVVIPRSEYERLRASSIPTIYLKGKAAKKLDQRVEKTIQAIKEGKGKQFTSLADLK